MKQTKLIYLIVAVMLYSSSSCNKQKDAELYPGVSLYKTRGDYFDKVSVGINDKGEIYRTSIARNKIIITETDTIPKNRVRLINGYILDSEADLEHDAFLSISYKEFLLWQEKYGETAAFIDTAWQYMLDQDPYTEYYRVKDRDMFYFEGVIDTTGLNQIIKEGRIEEYFNKNM